VVWRSACTAFVFSWVLDPGQVRPLCSIVWNVADALWTGGPVPCQVGSMCFSLECRPCTLPWRSSEPGQVRSGRRALVWIVAPVHWSAGLVVQAYNRSGPWGRHRVIHIHCLFSKPQFHTTYAGSMVIYSLFKGFVYNCIRILTCTCCVQRRQNFVLSCLRVLYWSCETNKTCPVQRKHYSTAIG